MIVLLEDECHLVWGDVGGMAWGKRNAPIVVPMTNERERQTYYGALNLLKTARNSEAKIGRFLKLLEVDLWDLPNNRLAKAKNHWKFKA